MIEFTSVTCIRCGRHLSDAVSVERVMGPVCWRRSGGGVFADAMKADDEKWAEREASLKAGGEEDFGQSWRWPVETDEGTVVRLARVSVRYRDGRFEAYARIADTYGPRDEVLYSGTDIRAAYQAAIEAGPQMEATSARVMRTKMRGVRA